MKQLSTPPGLDAGLLIAGLPALLNSLVPIYTPGGGGGGGEVGGVERGTLKVSCPRTRCILPGFYSRVQCTNHFLKPFLTTAPGQL